MKLYDYHTHNNYSGCASKYPYSVEDGWKTIQKRGVTKWGISNHFPTRKIYGDYLIPLRKEIDAMENENILLGVELELGNEEGKCPLNSSQLEKLDYIVGSVHDNPHNFLKLPDITEEETEEFFKSFRNKLINGFSKIPVRIWAHPFLNEFAEFGTDYWKEYIFPIFQDCLDILVKKQIAIEFNPSYAAKCKKYSELMSVLDEMFSLAVETPDVYFVTSSDAHSLKNLGDLTISLEYMKRYKAPENRILEIFKK